MVLVPYFSPFQYSAGFLVFQNILPISSLFLSLMPSLCLFMCIQPTSSSICSNIVRPSESYQPSGCQPTNVLSSFPVQRPIMQVCTPPPTCAAGGTWFGCGGGAKKTAPPAVVLIPSYRRQASPAGGQVHAYARRSVSLLILAVPAMVFSPSSRRQVLCACRDPTLDLPLDSCGARLSSFCPPPPLPLSPYNRTCPSTLPPNGRVFSWSLRAPLLRWARPSGRLLSTSLVPVLVLPPPLPIPWPSLLGRVVPYRASSSVLGGP